MGQDLAIAVPAAVGGCAATSWVVFADLAEDLPFAVLLQVQLQVRVALAVAWCEAETSHSMDLDEGEVKLSEKEGSPGQHPNITPKEHGLILRPGNIPGRLCWCVEGGVEGS